MLDRPRHLGRLPPPPSAPTQTGFRLPPEGALALLLSDWAVRLPLGLLYVATQERSVAEIARMASGFAPDLEVIALPAWDSLPYERARPSRAVTGTRVAGLARLAEAPERPRLVVTSAAGLLQRVPPRARLAERRVRLGPGDTVDPEWLHTTLEAFGYRFEERVDEAGEAAVRAGATDVFPAGASHPLRLELEEGRITALHVFDPLDQRSIEIAPVLTLLPATESFAVPGEQVSDIADRLLPDGPLETLFQALPGAAVTLDAGVRDRLSDWLATIADSYEARRLLKLAGLQTTLAAPDGLYLGDIEIEAGLAERQVASFSAEGGIAWAEAIPGEPARTFSALLSLAEKSAGAGDAVLVCTPEPSGLIRRLRRLAPQTLATWSDVQSLQKGAVAVLPLALSEGFRLPEGRAGCGLSVLTAQQALPRKVAKHSGVFPTDTLRIGDMVVEREHGLARLVGLELLEEPAGAREFLVLEFAADQRLLISAEHADQVWRYGSAEAAASPDRLTGEAWRRRRVEVEAEIAEVAAALADRRRLRNATKAPAVTPPRGAMDRFARRIPFALTQDQLAAVESTLADMARTRPMERLVCGDVGFGKTEVALHATAAAALAGMQVAVAAPTTLLARQHLATFQRRLGPLGIKVASLMRSVRNAESRATIAGLRSGDVSVVIGTHALASGSIRFAQLALVVIDEEQRFGDTHKRALHALRSGVHALTMTATPLPRSLQTAMAGLFDLSLLATPPVARQPVRTAVLPFDGAMVRAALLREARRGGQSFVVCPRIEDLPSMAERITGLVPELSLAQAHGKLKADALDQVMLDFAEGRTDVLLATGIIEAGLDIPNANTMLVWRPDRFGLAELHQLRGRVGRGRARASAYLLTDPGHALSRPAMKRLEQMAALDKLGAGFAISSADLDQRGAGDLLGERQAGHLRLMGSELYGQMLENAVAAARGKPTVPDWHPEIALDAAAFIPEPLVPEPDVRLELYRRLARIDRDEELEGFAEEIEDRFGDLGGPAETLLDLARLRLACHRAGIAALNAGPEAVALTPRADADVSGLSKRLEQSVGLRWSRDRLILEIAEPRAEQRLKLLLRHLRGAISAAANGH